ncbi:anti-CBASS protein Acb1 family protein [Bartonella sp. LJL80]
MTKKNKGQVLTFDGFANVIAGLGAANPKQSADTYINNCDCQSLENAYRFSTWFKKIVTVPAKDATRQGRTWKAEKEQVTAIEAVEKKHGVLKKVQQAIIWQRLYGGAVMVIGGLTGSNEEELQLDTVGKSALKSITVLSKEQIGYSNLISDPFSPWYGKPHSWTINTNDGQSVNLHPSRVILFNGDKVASNNNTTLWGDSIWAHMRDSVTASDAGASVIAALMKEAKVDIYGLPDMIGMMADGEGEQAIMKRFMMTNVLKSVTNSVIKDAEDTWDQKQINFSGLPDVMTTLLTIMAGAADIPVTRLIGKSASGLAATGEHDLVNYYDNIRSMQEMEITPAIETLDEIIIRSALGSRPDEIHYEWDSLWQPTEKEQAETAKIKAETTVAYVNSGLLPTSALSTGVQNQLVEDGTYPGLEQAMQDAENDLSLPDITEEEVERSLNVSDAAPKPLYVSRKVKNAKDILAWAKMQGFETTLKPDDLHVTIAYSRNPVDWMKVGESWQNEITISEGGPRLIEKFGDAVVLLISSNELSWRHKEIREAGASWDYDEYQPHITISYNSENLNIDSMSPYQGEIIFGPEIFEELGTEDLIEEV